MNGSLTDSEVGSEIWNIDLSVLYNILQMQIEGEVTRESVSHSVTCVRVSQCVKALAQ